MLSGTFSNSTSGSHFVGGSRGIGIDIDGSERRGATSLAAIRTLRASCSNRHRGIDLGSNIRMAATPLLALATAAIALLTLATTANGWFFLPGITPNEFEDGEFLPVYANKLISWTSRIPYDYQKMQFCSPDGNIMADPKAHSVETSFAQLLQGERSRLTAYRLAMLKDTTCVSACTSKFSAHDADVLKERIQQHYRVRLSLDDMPVVEPSKSNAFRLGYALGTHSSDNPAVVKVFNHLDFVVRYHEPTMHVPERISDFRSQAQLPKQRYRIVGFEVKPESRANGCNDNATTTIDAFELSVGSKSDVDIPFTYSVRFERSDVRWVTRFDTLTRVSAGRQKMQWFAVVNSLMLALFLSASLAAVLLRTLRRDCARYGLSAASLGDDFDDDFDADAGWRMLRGDVFRAPERAGLLCVLCGTGSQLVIVAFVTLFCALVGVLSPARRGSVLSGLLAAWVLSTGIAGYVAARLHKAMGGTNWKRVTIGVAFMLPGVAFGIFTAINVMMWSVGSIGAAPILAMLLLLFLWFGVSVPLAFAGTYFGYRHKAYNFSVRTNQIPRPIPAQPWLLRTPRIYAFCGLAPFAVVCLELRLILNDIWQNEFYHMFAFLFSVFVLLAIVSAEVSVVLVFTKLSNSDYMWWWDSWLACASSGVYVFLYSLCYLYMHGNGSSKGSLPAQILFVSYSFLCSFMFALLTGSIGFLSSLAFTRRIYSSSVYD